MPDFYHGKFFIDGEFRERYIEVRDGKIINISMNKGNGISQHLEGYILPAGIDIHVHFRDPGEEHKEDFYNGSRSAIYGGTSTVADMPNNIRPVNSLEAFKDKLNSIVGRSFTDFALYQLACGLDLEDSIGQKIFMGRSTGGIISNLEDVINNDKVKVVHAEDQSCLDKYPIDDKDLRSHDRKRPLECELSAIERIATRNFTRIHIAHVTSYLGVKLAKNFGFTTEVTPHHLLLNRDMNLGSFGKVNPPLRKKFVQEELLNQLSSGLIDIISSDHAPHTMEEKENFEDSPSGMPGVETRVPLILRLAKNGLIDLNYAVRLLSENPAKLLNLKKGSISIGNDADFIITDFEERPIKSENLHYKCGWTAFEGFMGIFPSGLVQRGEEIMVEGEIVEEPRGAFLSGKERRI